MAGGKERDGTQDHVADWGMKMQELFEKIANLEQREKTVVLTVIEGENFGEKALMEQGKLLWKSCSNGFFSEQEGRIIQRGSTGKMVAAGQTVFCDCLGQEKQLVICGGGHVSTAIISIGKMLGFTVTVLEDRPYFADQARKIGADQVVCDSFAESLQQIPGDEDTYFVIVTRGHRYDQVCLEQILGKKYAYVGMMGSRKRVAALKETILEKGFSKEKVEELHSPIGLSIRAETPEEIAVSVMAEIIEVKNKAGRTESLSSEMVKVLAEKGEQGKALATIVSRRGSAPRKVGTKMVIFPDGKTMGTIGGGCMEAEVIQQALGMLRAGKPEIKIYPVDMTSETAEDEGMVCGGSIDVLLELLPGTS